MFVLFVIIGNYTVVTLRRAVSSSQVACWQHQEHGGGRGEAGGANNASLINPGTLLSDKVAELIT
jgi:hypothetical protein